MKAPKELNRRNLGLFGIGAILVLAFVPTLFFQTSNAQSPPILVSSGFTACNGTPTCTKSGFTIYSGDILVAAISVSGAPNGCGSSCGVTFSSFSDSLGNTFVTAGKQTNAQNPMPQLLTIFALANITHAGNDALTLTLTVQSGSTGLEQTNLAVYDIAGDVSYATATKNGGVLNSTACCAVPAKSYSNSSFLIQAISDDCVGACSGATDLTYTNPPPFTKTNTFVVGSTTLLGAAYSQRANSINSPNTFPAVNNGGGTDRYWTESVLVLSTSSGGGGGGGGFPTPILYASCTGGTYGAVWSNAAIISCTLASHPGDVIIMIYTGQGPTGCVSPHTTDTSGNLFTVTTGTCLSSQNGVVISSAFWNYANSTASSETISSTNNGPGVYGGFEAFDIQNLSPSNIIAGSSGALATCGCIAESSSTYGQVSLMGFTAWLNTNASGIWISPVTSVAQFYNNAHDAAGYIGNSTGNGPFGARLTDQGGNFPTYLDWASILVTFPASPGGGGCPSCVVSTGTTTFLTTDTTVIGGTTVVDGTKTVSCGTFTLPLNSTATLCGTTFINSHNVTSTFTTTLGSTYVSSTTRTTTTTNTQTVLNAPNTDSFQFWALPMMFNFIVAFLFITPAIVTKVSNAFLYGMLFTSGLTFGGIFGLLARITPWYDPVICALMFVAVLVVRGL